MHEREVEDLNEELSKLVEHHVKLQVGSIVRAIRGTGGKISKMLWGGVVVALLAGAFAGYIINRNRQAIRVSCLLLSEKIVEAGGVAVPPKGYKPTPAARAQAEITARLLERIDDRILTAADRDYIAARRRIITQSGGSITLPDCGEVTRHPGRVADQLEGRK